MNLTGAALREANLSELHLSVANPAGVCIVKAYFFEADLVRAGLTGANLNWANL